MASIPRTIARRLCGKEGASSAASGSGSPVTNLLLKVSVGDEGVHHEVPAREWSQ